MSVTRLRNLAALPLATLLAVALTISPAQARDTASPSGAAVASGVVTGSSGAAMAGVAVDLYAWPSDAALQALKIGQIVPTTLLATTVTNKAGAYTLRVPVAQLKAAAAGPGYANLEISDAGDGIWFFSYRTGSLPAHPAAPLVVNLPERKRLCGTDPSGEVYSNTGWFKLRQRDPAWAVVGQGYIAPGKKTAGDRIQFDYNQTTTANQASTLGVGVSGYGFDAGYSTSGSSTSTANSGEDYPSESKSTWFRTQFSVGQFRALCYEASGQTVPHNKQRGKCPRIYKNKSGGVFHVHKCVWMIKSTGWYPSATVVHPADIPSTRYCGIQGAGTAFHTTDETAIQWSHGWDLGAALDLKGVNLKASYGTTAQTGYDQNAEIKFMFHRAGQVCGTNHVPDKAAMVVMRG